MSDERTDASDDRVSDATRRAEAQEAHADHVADRTATTEEEEAVEGLHGDPDVRTHYREMTELGADEVGEGRIP